MKSVIIVLVGLWAFLPGASAGGGHFEDHLYVGNMAAGVPCLGTLGPGLGSACFTVLPGETTAAIRISDFVYSSPIGGSYQVLQSLRVLAGGPFCGNIVLSLPPGTDHVMVFVTGNPVGGCPPNQPTVGNVLGSFS